jgi:hypothetical protein
VCALIARLTSTQASASERAGGSRLEAGRLGRRQRLVLAAFGAAAQAHPPPHAHRRYTGF